MQVLEKKNKKDAQMAEVGDRVTIEITGPGTLASASTASISIGGASIISVPGRIIQDLGDNWLIELDVSFAGNNRISVSKASIR